MVMVSGNNDAKYKVGTNTVSKDLVGIKYDGAVCSPQLDETFPDDSDGLASERCDDCIGVSVASRNGRWIYRCGGKDSSDACELFCILSICSNYGIQSIVLYRKICMLEIIPV